MKNTSYEPMVDRVGFEPTYDGVKIRCLTSWLSVII